MSEKLLHIQLGVLAVVATLVTVGSFAYVLWSEPASLHVSRNGVPFFTPPVEHPDTGEPVSVDELVRHLNSLEAQ